MGRDREARAEARPLRLFVAVDVPGRVRELVAGTLAPWREAFPAARWVPPENWHVTVKFLGRTWPRLLAWVEDRVRAVAADHRPFQIRASGVGAFPSARRARVLWVGLDDPEGGLRSLARGLDAALEREFPPERRDFTAHLTVARSEPPLALPEDFARTELRSEPFEVRALVLYRSHLQRPAPRYEPVGTFPLRG
ncbi:MAG TPA: RNA 2',3'-cyclic phosphodiesterase [Actinomycetota bacterium]|nr:RNA 2',3'-cyclic phosphodiesterase [Actinomycetota bacterium]